MTDTKKQTCMNKNMLTDKPNWTSPFSWTHRKVISTIRHGDMSWEIQRIGGPFDREFEESTVRLIVYRGLSVADRWEGTQVGAGPDGLTNVCIPNNVRNKAADLYS